MSNSAECNLAGCYRVELLTVGYPGTTADHGGLGWASIGLVRDGKRNILIDVGGPNLQLPLTKALRSRGLTFEAITDVFITHSHWDHIGNVRLFPNAQFIISGQELAWGRAQPPGTWQIADLELDWLLARPERVVKVSDSDEAIPGIVAIATPGHTPGHLAFRVRGTDRDYIFAGDAIKNRAELLTGEVAMTLDKSLSRSSLERIRRELTAMSAVSLVPGHDVQMRFVDGNLQFEGRPRAQITALLGQAGAPVVFDL